MTKIGDIKVNFSAKLPDGWMKFARNLRRNVIEGKISSDRAKMILREYLRNNLSVTL